MSSIQETNLKAIADAIREKDGTTEPISANQFANRIKNIPTSAELPDDICEIKVLSNNPLGGTVSGGGMLVKAW